MNPVAVVIPSALLYDAAAVGKEACEMAGVETTLIVSPDPDATGFTRTVNRGLAQVPEGYDVLLLNDDVGGFYPGWLDQLQCAMYDRDDIGIIGPSGDCNTNPIAEWEGDDGADLQSVRWFPFFCTLVRRECYEQVGQLNQRFIHYSSDYDYCDRARDLGWMVVWCKTVIIDHELNGSARRQAWAAHDLALYQLMLKRRKARGQWLEVVALPS